MINTIFYSRVVNHTPEGKAREYDFVLSLQCGFLGLPKQFSRQAFGAKTYIGVDRLCFNGHLFDYDEYFWLGILRGYNCGKAHAYARISTDKIWRAKYKEEGKPFALIVIDGNNKLRFKRR